MRIFNVRWLFSRVDPSLAGLCPLGSSAEIAVWSSCLLSTFMAFAMLQATHTGLMLAPFAGMSGVLLFLLGIYFVYARLRPEPRISAISGGLVAVSWAGLMAGITALAALRTNAPLIDVFLAHVDEFMGVDLSIFVTWVAQHRSIGWILEIAYASSVPLVFAAIILLALINRVTRMWQTCFVFGSSAMLCAMTSAFLPAMGTFSRYEGNTDILAGLPDDAGRFYLAAFEGYRSGAFHIVDIRHLEGVVTFPSFHAVMALVVACSFRDMRWLSGLIWVWSSLILLSTIPIGGHYLVDLLAGAAVWIVFMALFSLRNSLRDRLCFWKAAVSKTQVS